MEEFGKLVEQAKQEYEKEKQYLAVQAAAREGGRENEWSVNEATRQLAELACNEAIVVSSALANSPEAQETATAAALPTNFAKAENTRKRILSFYSTSYGYWPKPKWPLNRLEKKYSRLLDEVPTFPVWDIGSTYTEGSWREPDGYDSISVHRFLGLNGKIHIEIDKNDRFVVVSEGLQPRESIGMISDVDHLASIRQGLAGLVAKYNLEIS